MAVLAADTNIPHFDGALQKISVQCDTADIFYKGAIVWQKAAGYATVAPSAGDRPIGICCAQVTTTAQGQLVDIYTQGLFSFPLGTGVTIADTGGRLIFDVSSAITDNPADTVSAEDTTLAANDATVGRIMDVINSRAIVQIGGITGDLIVVVATTPQTDYWK